MRSNATMYDHFFSTLVRSKEKGLWCREKWSRKNLDSSLVLGSSGTWRGTLGQNYLIM